MTNAEIANLTDRQLRDWALSLAAQKKRESDVAYWMGAVDALTALRSNVRSRMIATPHPKEKPRQTG